jgi:H+/Cl- antiporter ClcA
VASGLSKLFRLERDDRRVLIMAGMSAVFAGLFGTPLTAALFCMEFESVGTIFSPALLPCYLAAFTASSVSARMGVHAEGLPLDTAAVLSLNNLWAYLLLAVLGAFGEIRQNRREYALLRQWGTPDETILRKARLTQFYAAKQGLLVMVGMFTVLFLMPVFLSGWIFTGTPLSRFLLSPPYTAGVIFSCLAAVLLQLGNFAIGQFVITFPIRRMLQRGILDDLRHVE